MCMAVCNVGLFKVVRSGMLWNQKKIGEAWRIELEDEGCGCGVCEGCEGVPFHRSRHGHRNELRVRRVYRQHHCITCVGAGMTEPIQPCVQSSGR